MQDAGEGNVISDRLGADPTEIWASPSVRHVLDSMSDGFGAFDREIRVLHLNRVAVARRGLPYDEMVGRSFWEIYPHLQPYLGPPFREALENDRHLRIDFFFAEKAAWFEVDIYPVGGILHVYTRDITDRKKQELERDAREGTLRFLSRLGEETRNLPEPVEVARVCAEYLTQHLDASRGTYGEIAPDGHTLTIERDHCQECESILGTYDLRAFGESVFARLSSGEPLAIHDTEIEFSGTVAEAYRATAIRSQIAVPLVKNGRFVALFTLQQTTPRRWTQGELELLGMVADRCWSEIERARTEVALRRSEQRLREILDISTVGVVVNDARGTFLYANPPLLRMLGYSPDDVRRGELTWNRIQAPDRRESDDVALAEIRLGGSCTPYETEYVAKDGHRVPVYVGAAAVPDETGTGLLGTAFITDMTALKQAQRELMALNADLDRRVQERTAALQRANEAMSDFTYHIAHDLRAPLRAIVATSRMLQDDYGSSLPDAAAHLLERQISAGNKLGTLIDELLQLSRLDRAEAIAEDVDLTALAREVADEHAPDNPLAVVEVQEGLRAHADPRLLRLLLSNLISNALRYSPNGGAVTVGRDEEPEGPAFFVRDHGIGFDMAYAHKLFKPFERLVTDRDFPGTGVGLANVARIVAKHRGKVWARSEPGRGATFYFTLG